MSTKPLPRRDLREEAFRKYESFIARACYKPIFVDPKVEMDPPLAATTFAARIRDAILAKRRYGYSSTIIPEIDLSQLEVLEYSDGRVLIQNKTPIIPEKPVEKPNLEPLVLAAMHKVARKEAKDFTLTADSKAELAEILAIAAKHDDIDCMVVAQDGNAYFYTV